MPFRLQTESGEIVLLNAPITSTECDLLIYAILTVVLEVPIFYILGYRNSKILISFATANIISNLLLNEYLMTISVEEYWWILLWSEIVVVVFEYCFMCYYIPKDKLKLLKSLSITNLISCMIGVAWFLLLA